jgi:hypothetical protein
MMVIFQKNPGTQFSGASRHIASQNSQYFKPQTNTSTFTVLNAGKRDEKKKKCAPHIPYRILELLVICVV